MEEEILAASLSSPLLVRKICKEEISYESCYEFITKVIMRKIYYHLICKLKHIGWHWSKKNPVCCKSGFNNKVDWFVLGRHIMSDGGGFQTHNFGVVKISMATYESD